MLFILPGLFLGLFCDFWICECGYLDKTDVTAF